MERSIKGVSALKLMGARKGSYKYRSEENWSESCDVVWVECIGVNLWFLIKIEVNTDVNVLL